MYCDRLHLKLYSNYTKYNFHDILISMSLKFLSYIASQPEELKEIFSEFEMKNDVEAHFLEDVTEHI